MADFIPALPGDEYTVGRLRQQCWAATYRGIYPDAMIDHFDYAGHAERDRTHITDSRYRVYLIADSNQPIGYMTLQLDTPLLLHSLYLLPAWQRCGIGRQAFALVRQLCAEHSQEAFICHCQPENHDALAFYRRMGGVIIAQDIGNAEPFMNSVTLRFPVDAVRRCRWCNPNNPRYIAYHDTEWGVPCHNDHRLFEMLILEGFQAGLSWECVLNKRSAFREAFDGFDLEKVMAYGEDKVAKLLNNTGIIRNRLKVRAAIRNAQVFHQIQQEFGSFNAYLRTFTGDHVIIEHDKTSSELSDRLSRDLHRRGMRFVGTTIIYAYLQSIGAINSHEPDCDLYQGKR
ncbi:MAG: GNAT family N-acetyltransferase [Clostridia bacterium]|nr:GNAT family N-acetyltransferase [Clostridia bacterium]